MSGAGTVRNTRRWLLVTLEIGLAVLVVWSIYHWRTRDLLPADGVDDAPYFELQDLAGRTWTLDDFGERPTVLYFFAPWCQICNASAHQLRWFHRLFEAEIDVVMVALEHTGPDQLREYRRDHRIESVILMGDAGVASDYRIRGFPTYYVLDEAGRIRRRDFGFSTVAGLWLRTCLTM